MAEFELTILGSNSAVPAHNRNPTAQLLKHKNLSILIDCGEGTQFQMNKFRIKRGKLDYILISHMHGDHYFGLVGLLNSLKLNGRTTDLHVFAPPELEQVILLQADFKAEDWPFNLYFHAMSFDKSYLLFETEDLKVRTIPLDHRTPCNGFLIEEKVKQRKIVSNAVRHYGVPHTFMKNLKMGEDFVQNDGNLVNNELLTEDPPPSNSYAYCSDTKYNESILPLIAKATLLYHEATFLEESKDKAQLRFHSTTKEAATIALKAQVGQLIIGHYSAKYKDLNPLLNEVREVFPNAVLAIEGKTYEIVNKA